MQNGKDIKVKGTHTFTNTDTHTHMQTFTYGINKLSCTTATAGSHLFVPVCVSVEMEV